MVVQSQKAGDNSQLFQSDVTIVQAGIDEKRVREIFDELLPPAIQNYCMEAGLEAKKRNGHFKKIMIERMLEENALEIFSDPSFQFLLQEAQKRAAMTEREKDYELLAELMVHRFHKQKDRKAKAGIVRAVEIVDQISDEALLGLTILHSVSVFSPRANNLEDGLKILDNLFGEIIYDKLPQDFAWLDHLDVLDAARVNFNGIGGTKLLEEYWYESMDGFTSFGIKTGSEEYKKACKMLKEINLDIACLHDNGNEYVNLGVINKSAIPDLTITHANGTESRIDTKQQKVLENIYDMYDGEKIKMDEFIRMIDGFKTLSSLRQWWNHLNTCSFHITSVGQVLAHSNAQRIDNKLPALD